MSCRVWPGVAIDVDVSMAIPDILGNGLDRTAMDEVVLV
jgi:hypothetical protein